MAAKIEHPHVAIISDLHVGDPDGVLDDFRSDQRFHELLTDVLPAAGPRTTLIINGDFIDFPQVLPELAFHRLGRRFGCPEVHSHQKMRTVLDGHPQVFAALAAFIRDGNQVIFLPGNHDIDLHWPSVWKALVDALGADEPRVSLVREGSLCDGYLYVEHGNQYSYENSFEHWTDPLLDAPDGKRIERPWGTYFMDEVYNDLRDAYSFINKVYPHIEYASIIARSFGSDENASPRFIARLVAFFLREGKEFLARRYLLGADAAPAAADGDDVAQLLTALGIEPGTPRASAIEAALADEGIRPAGAAPDAAPTNLLGQTEERGLSRRAHQVLQNGMAKVVAFGHTHSTRAERLGKDDPRGIYNTGSWMPHIPIAPGQKPRWSELASLPERHTRHYLSVRAGDPGATRLVPLD